MIMEAMKATKKKAKTAKYLRLDDDKESQEGYDKESQEGYKEEAKKAKYLRLTTERTYERGS